MGAAALGLVDDGRVPVQADGGQVAELAGFEVGPGVGGVEVVDPQAEAAPGRAGEAPGQQRRAQVAHVEGPGGARRVPTVGHQAPERTDQVLAAGVHEVG